jgi:hypothetical protein
MLKSLVSMTMHAQRNVAEDRIWMLSLCDAVQMFKCR